MLGFTEEAKLVSYVVAQTNSYIKSMPKTLRKSYGQFFTSAETAVFMASLFKIPRKKSLTILDPGAGAGILSAALIERLLRDKYVESIELVCYENDKNILEQLRSNLAWIQHNSNKKVSYDIIKDNYILSQKKDYNSKSQQDKEQKFDLVIGNPPYMKVGKEAPEALAMPDVCFGAPNLYFLFMSMAIFNLCDGGELVFVIPRSWTSGAYFKKFREKLFRTSSLVNIHLFVSRDRVFEQENVLQETIIVKVVKSKKKPAYVTISTSNSNSDFQRLTTFKAPYDIVVRGEENYVYLVTNKTEVETLLKLNSFEYTLPVIGLRMKTGITVDFRNRDLLRDTPDEGTIPLFYSQHIHNGEVTFPVGQKFEYITSTRKGLLQKNSNYLFVKRFTAKEEHRRLQCGIYLAKNLPQYSQISTQNKINFICGTNELSESLVYGLYVIFNSSLYDAYYRILNGSTQVNSTEINKMPVPSIEVIETMGRKLIFSHDLSEKNCNEILKEYT